jgi:catechol 2,3-dioxygenase-like lactoylglutathione lyase family enzyme
MDQMRVQAIDHINLSIPEDGIARVIEFYHDVLGFDIENRDLYEARQRSFFSIRLAEGSVIHLRPSSDFEIPTGNSFNHIALRIEESIDDIRPRLTAHNVNIERESTPLGATGTARALYVRDPAGYLLEIKEEPTQQS